MCLALAGGQWPHAAGSSSFADLQEVTSFVAPPQAGHLCVPAGRHRLERVDHPAGTPTAHWMPTCCVWAKRYHTHLGWCHTFWLSQSGLMQMRAADGGAQQRV